MPGSTSADRTLGAAVDLLVEAQSANHGQALALLNVGTDEVDSLIEEIAAANIPEALRARLLGYCHDLLDLNAHELSASREAAGIVDQAAAPRRADHRVGRTNDLTVKALARRLRPALAVMAAPNGFSLVEFVDAARVIDAITQQVPLHQLLTASIRKELGPGRYALLEQIALGQPAVADQVTQVAA